MTTSPAADTARDAVLGVVCQILETPDDRLPTKFEWRGVSLEFRHGIFALLENVERAEVQSGAGRSSAALMSAQVSAARWALRGALLPFNDPDLDTEPAAGEWPLRTTLTHIVSAQEWWTWLAGYWAERLASGAEPGHPPREQVPAKFTEGAREPVVGGLTEILPNLDSLVDAAVRPLHSLESHFGSPVRWNGAEVRLDFYPFRWTQHLREHTLQVDKTASLLGRRPSEQQRIARLLLEAFGRLEGPYLTGEASGLEEMLAGFNAEAAGLFPTLRP